MFLIIELCKMKFKLIERNMFKFPLHFPKKTTITTESNIERNDFN